MNSLEFIILSSISLFQPPLSQLFSVFDPQWAHLIGPSSKEEPHLPGETLLVASASLRKLGDVEEDPMVR